MVSFSDAAFAPLRREPLFNLTSAESAGCVITKGGQKKRGNKRGSGPRASDKELAALHLRLRARVGELWRVDELVRRFAALAETTELTHAADACQQIAYLCGAQPPASLEPILAKRIVPQGGRKHGNGNHSKQQQNKKRPYAQSAGKRKNGDAGAAAAGAKQAKKAKREPKAESANKGSGKKRKK